jgi:hypothetical protein
MNLTQWLMIAVPTVLAYLWFVAMTETDGRVNRRTNLWSGLVVIPFAAFMLPALLVQALASAVTKRQWRVMAGALVGLLVISGYAWVVFALRDQAPVTVTELPLDR